MQTYSLERQIQSCSVTKDVVAQLERYILQRINQIDDFSIEKIKEEFHIEIVDSVGTEKIESIELYIRERFPNDTNRIALSYRVYDSKAKAQEIRIVFAKAPSISQLKVSINGTGCKELAIGVVHEVERIIKDSANLNYIFYGKYSFIQYGILLFSFLIASNADSIADAGIDHGKVLTLARSLWLECAVWAALRWCNPYLVFDTHSNEAIQQWLGWFLKGAAGVVVLGALSKVIW